MSRMHESPDYSSLERGVCELDERMQVTTVVCICCITLTEQLGTKAGLEFVAVRKAVEALGAGYKDGSMPDASPEMHLILGDRPVKETMQVRPLRNVASPSYELYIHNFAYLLAKSSSAWLHTCKCGSVLQSHA